MTYLTQDDKQLIMGNAFKKGGITDRVKKLEKRRAEWAEKIRLDAIGGKGGERRLKAFNKRAVELNNEFGSIIESQPASIRTYMLLNIEGKRFNAYFNGTRYGIGAPSFEKIAPRQFTLKVGHPLAKEFDKLEKIQEQIDRDEQEIRASVQPVLDKVRTEKSLLKLWPEAKVLLPKKIGEPKTTALAIPLEGINKKLGLTK